MNILRVISSVNPEGGGPIESVKQSSLIIAQQSHKVEIASLDDPNESFLGSFPFTVHALGPVAGTYGYSKRLKNWLRDNIANYDAVIVEGLWQYCGFAARAASVKSDVPYFVFTHGMLDPWFKKRYPLKHLKKWLYWPWGEYRVLRDAKKVLFTVEEEKRLARESFWLYNVNEQVVNFGTADRIGDKVQQVAAFQESFPHLTGKKYLLYLSRIHPKKGVDLLISSLAALENELADYELVIAGPNQVGWQEELEKLAKELGVDKKITWAGMLSGDLKWGAFLAADAFVLPSHQENFGIVVAEALSCGKPVLITDKVNIHNEVIEARAGLVCNDNIEGITGILRSYQALPKEVLVRMSDNARELFVNKFHVNAAADSLLAVLKN